VDAQHVRPPAFEVHAVFVVRRVPVHETEEPHVALGVGDDAVELVDAQQEDVTFVDAATLVEQLLAGLVAEVKAAHGALAGDVLPELLPPVVKGKGLAVGLAPVGAAFQLHL